MNIIKQYFKEGYELIDKDSDFFLVAKEVKEIEGKKTREVISVIYNGEDTIFLEHDVVSSLTELSDDDIDFMLGYLPNDWDVDYVKNNRQKFDDNLLCYVDNKENGLGIVEHVNSVAKKGYDYSRDWLNDIGMLRDLRSLMNITDRKYKTVGESGTRCLDCGEDEIELTDFKCLTCNNDEDNFEDTLVKLCLNCGKESTVFYLEHVCPSCHYEHEIIYNDSEI